MIDLLDTHHGQVTGMFTGDECLSGRNPLQGTELCAVVEFLYSLEHLFAVFGDPRFGDRLERVAFNALPATFTPDMWAHQYDQQVNQVQCTVNPDHGWSSNGPESNIYGLEPNFGCCTANMHQGWPKLAAHLWMRTPDEGLAVAAYAPSRAVFTSKGVRRHRDDGHRLPVPRDDRDAHRRRGAPSGSRCCCACRRGRTGRQCGSAAGREEAMAAGTLHRIEREWSGTVELEIRFPMRGRMTTRYNEAVAVERGPLVYALKIGEQWTRINADKPQRDLPHGDFEVRPTTPWNYGADRPGRRSRGVGARTPAKVTRA